MKQFTVIVELKPASINRLKPWREEVTFQAMDRDQARRILEDSFPGEIISIEFLTEEDV